MYEIFAGDVCIHSNQSPLETVKVLDPKLTLEDNVAGSLTFIMPPDNVGYGIVERLTTVITVKRDGEEIWSGRVITEEVNFWNQRKVTCEGELALLNDTCQPPAEYHDMTPLELLTTFISIHNAKVPASKQFAIGAVTVTDPNDSLYRYTNYESTLQCIQEKLIEKLGGHLRIRKVNGVRYLDYLRDYVKLNPQKIEFGKNLLDFTKSWDLTELATVIVPLGASLNESPIEALTAYTTVKSVNQDSIYVQSQEAVENYGWIEAVVHWDDVKEPSNLLTKAQKYLQEEQFEEMVLELSAIDLNTLNPDISGIDLLDEVECISRPHGMDRRFPVKKITIPIAKPEETAYTLGDKQKTSLSDTIRKGNEEIQEKIEVTKNDALERAKHNATEIINLKTQGYITIVSNQDGSQELIISDNPDISRAEKMWKWNINGLGYSNDGGQTFGLAMTMNGEIVADFITTGVLNAARIKAGKLEDKIGRNYWNLEDGSFQFNGVLTEAQVRNIVNSAVNGAMTQENIFNKLTNNGQLKGLYMANNELYINASYIHSGSLSADYITAGTISANKLVGGCVSSSWFPKDRDGKAYLDRVRIGELEIKAQCEVFTGEPEDRPWHAGDSCDLDVGGRTLEFAHGILIDH